MRERYKERERQRTSEREITREREGERERERAREGERGRAPVPAPKHLGCTRTPHSMHDASASSTPPCWSSTPPPTKHTCHASCQIWPCFPRLSLPDSAIGLTGAGPFRPPGSTPAMPLVRFRPGFLCTPYHPCPPCRTGAPHLQKNAAL